MLKSIFAGAALILYLSGCAVIVGGGLVYAISEDTVEAVTKHSEAHAYSTSLAVLKGYGNVTLADKGAAHIKADVDKDIVEAWIVPDPQNSSGSKIRVKARTLAGAFPKLDKAKEVLNTILRRL